MPDKDVVLAKVATIQRCLAQIRDVTSLDPARLYDGYRAMAMDAEREKEAAEWCDALSRGATDEAR